MKRVNLLLVSLLFSTSNGWASTLNVDLTGGVARWGNAIVSSSGDDMVPSFWTPTHCLTPTAKWIPGAFVTPPPTTIMMSSGGASIAFPITFKGFEYHTGSAGTVIGNGSSGGPYCSSGDFTSGIATVMGGAGCLLVNNLTTGAKVVTPYAFIRPIFSIDDTALADAFDKQPQGLYRGSVSLSQFYQYYLGDIKTQYIDSQPFVLEISHTPAYITSVELTGESEMKPVYGVGTDDVSAKTSFDVTASGFFSDGMKVMLNRSDDYILRNSGSEIPYSIKCIGCSDGEYLVEEGVVSNPSSPSLKVSGVEVNTINFTIDVEFNAVPLDPLEVGSYTDTFTLIFEPDV
ncbi:hypothetical protein [Shewanella sp.]|uniref:hypothetical protein n=1 Tax=Shewanella sp. TaxID=50422 RepID=UPI0025836782|nr:hypothetical protein [Shewanella sp.]MCJ8303311.1 hypothetical protein [Shewanella sp.]